MRTTLLVSLILSPLTALAAFSDTAQHPFSTSIDYVKQHGIVQGYNDGTYRPDAFINRAEFVKIVMGSHWEQSVIDSCLDEVEDIGLSDVPRQEWYAAYVCAAKKHDIIRGYEDGTFLPSASINYAEAAKIIANAFSLSVNVGSSGPWYEKFVDAIKDVDAEPSGLSPSDELSRGQMAYIIHHVHAYVNEVSEGIGQGANGGVYMEYFESAVGNGAEAILFFHAPWCPYCAENHNRLTEWYGAETFSRTVLKVDFDTATELKQRYGVTQQDTFVLVNGDGDSLSQAHSPSEQALRDLLK